MNCSYCGEEIHSLAHVCEEMQEAADEYQEKVRLDYESTIDNKHAPPYGESPLKKFSGDTESYESFFNEVTVATGGDTGSLFHSKVIEKMGATTVDWTDFETIEPKTYKSSFTFDPDDSDVELEEKIGECAYCPCDVLDDEEYISVDDKLYCDVSCLNAERMEDA